MTPKLAGAIAFVAILLLATNVYAQNPVSIEFFYIDPSQFEYQCWTCPGWVDTWNKFLSASTMLDQIQSEYSNQVQIERVDKTTAEGLARFTNYSLTESQAVVINKKIKLEGEQLTKENLKTYIDSYLRGEDPTINSAQTLGVVVAFSVGIFSGLTPCLMGMLAFILSYASGTVSSFKSGMLRVLVFGLGFVTAIMTIGTLVATAFTAIPSVYLAVMWAVSILMILVGLNLIGWLKVPFHPKFFIEEAVQRRGFTILGLFGLGFVFYFVNLCAAPLSLTFLPTLAAPQNLYLLAVFGIGALTPFLAVGIIAGGSPTLARKIIKEQHRIKIRVISGIVLIAYSSWFITFNLLYSKIYPAYLLVSGLIPALIALFAFILTYSASASASVKGAIGNSLIPALGFIAGIMLTMISFVTMGSAPYIALFNNRQTLTAVTAALLIAIGLILAGLLKIPLSSDSFIRRLHQKNVLALSGLFVLGLLLFPANLETFPFTRFVTIGTSIDFNLLLTFNLELLVPFLAVGIISGVARKLPTDIIDKHRTEIRAVSGLILIAYAAWLLWLLL